MIVTAVLSAPFECVAADCGPPIRQRQIAEPRFRQNRIVSLQLDSSYLIYKVRIEKKFNEKKYSGGYENWIFSIRSFFSMRKQRKNDLKFRPKLTRTRPWQSMVLPSLTSLKVPINPESGLVKAVTRNPAQSNSLVVFFPFAISSMICLFSA